MSDVLKSEQSSAYLQTFKTLALLTAIILCGFYLLSSIIIPIIMAFMLYALLEPITLYLVRRNINHSLSIVMLLIIMLGLSLLAISFALPQLFEQVSILQGKLPLIFEKFEQYVTQYSHKVASATGVEFNATDILSSVASQFSSLGNSVLVKASEQVVALTLFLILVPILTYFILKDYKSVRNKMLNWLPNSSFELGWIIYHRVTHKLQLYTRGVMIQSLIMAVVSSIGFIVIGLDIPILLGCLTGLLNLIPYIGPLISMILATLVASAMTPFDSTIIYLSIVVIIIAQLVDNLIVIPSIIANSVDLHPVFVIVGIIIFGNLFGTIGIILAIPALATIKIINQCLYADIANANEKTQSLQR